MANRILLVDDDSQVLEMLAEILDDNGYEVTAVSSGYAAIEQIKDNYFDLVITDIRMAGLDGLDTIASLRENQPDLKSIIITGYASTQDPIRALKLRVDDYLKKPFDTKEFLASVQRSLEDFQQRRREKDERKKFREDFINTIKQIALAIERRDPYLGSHSQNVALYSLKIGRELGLSRENLEKLEIAAFLHDLGQVEVEQAVLQKRGPLSGEEYDRIKNHPAFARDLLAAIPGFQDVIDIILHHHEKYDGSGYPSGLGGDEIPLESRILAISEAYVALLEERPHRDSSSPEQALELMQKDAGGSHDPALMKVLRNCVFNEEADAALEQGEEKEEELTREKKRRTLLELGHTYRELRQHAVARQAYEESIDAEGSPDSMTVEALRGLSLIALAQGNFGEAMSLADRAGQAASLTSRYQQARVLQTRGRILMEDGKLADADAALKAAEEIFRRWEATYDLAATLLARASAGGGSELEKVLTEAVGLVKRFGYYDMLVPESPALVPVLLRGIAGGIAASDCRDFLLRLLKKAPSSLERVLSSASLEQQFLLLEIVREGNVSHLPEVASAFLASGFPQVKEKASQLFKESAAKPRALRFKACCLGNFRLFVNDRLISEELWKTKKSKYLLAFILSHWQGNISEEKIFEIFWGDFPQKKARQSLHSALYQIRQVLDPFIQTPGFELLAHEKEFYFVNPAVEISIDVREFTELTAAGLKNIKAGLADEGIASLQRAESCYLGDFLDGYLSDWAEEYRNSVRLKYQDVLLALVRHFHDTNRYEVCLEYAQKLIQCDICNEKAHYYVIKSHMGLGSRVEAMKAYQQCAAIMKKELGMSPMPEIEALKIYLKD